MTEPNLDTILSLLKDQGLTPEDLIRTLSLHGLAGQARLDLGRAKRKGFPEVVLGRGKTPEEVIAALEGLHRAGQTAIATRVEDPQPLIEAFPQGAWHSRARLFEVDPRARPEPRAPAVGLVTAGLSDLPVAEEAGVLLEAAGLRVERVQDVGVAGLHRLLANLDKVRGCRVLIAVAGMEAALPSVLAGLLPQPVIGLPTSTGYGVAAGGLAALAGMLSSCAPGLAVVNVDNGYGAAMMAHAICLQIEQGGEK